MRQYIALCKKVLEEGVWVDHRSGKKRLTLINADLEYDCSTDHVPVLTTKRVYWKSAIAEMLGYLRGYDSAKQFRDIGCNTWNSNANENEEWLGNPYRKGEDDMGRVYGVQLRDWTSHLGDVTDQLREVYEKLRRGVDDARLIMTFHNPGEVRMGCLPACMHTHTFSLLGNTLHLTSYQRSADLALGVPFNMVQCAWLLKVMAQITGHRAGMVFHKLVNVHIYDDQLADLRRQLKRKPYDLPKLIINPAMLSLEDLEKGMVVGRDHELLGYSHHPAIKFKFTT